MVGLRPSKASLRVGRATLWRRRNPALPHHPRRPAADRAQQHPGDRGDHDQKRRKAAERDLRVGAGGACTSSSATP
jgi:hypothetical protein